MRIVLNVLRHVLLWLLGVALGVAVLLGAVMAASYAFTTSGSLPAPDAQFGGAALTVNGSRWRVPLVGGMLDKAFYSPSTLSVEKLGVLYEAHPEITLPEWATYATLRITADGMGDAAYFDGPVEDYAAFLYPANGEYKAELTVWRLPVGMTDVGFGQPADGAVLPGSGLERPARPAGYYRYAFRFTIQASAELTLSAQRIEQGGVAALEISGMVGSGTPAVETDLGSVQCVRSPAGWRCYIPAAYNASAGSHDIAVTVNGQILPLTLVVTAKTFGEAEAQPDPPAPSGAAEEFRNVIWSLYEAPAREKMWHGAFLCPVELYTVLLDYGQTKVMGGARAGQSNSTLLYTIPGDPVRAPANGVVAVAQELGLTGNTVVIDHGCGLRSYLYGLGSIHVQPGQTVARGDALGQVGETLTMDFKLGSKSISPWPLFQTSGGLFWKEF